MREKPDNLPVSPQMMDTSHVPAPDAEYFWPFVAGQSRVIGMQPILIFRVDTILPDRVLGTETLDAVTVAGELLLDRPVVIAKSEDNEPLVTLTLRKIESGTAFIQVTGNPKMKVGWRQ